MGSHKVYVSLKQIEHIFIILNGCWITMLFRELCNPAFYMNNLRLKERQIKRVNLKALVLSEKLRS